MDKKTVSKWDTVKIIVMRNYKKRNADENISITNYNKNRNKNQINRRKYERQWLCKAI